MDSQLALGSLLFADINSPAAAAAGITAPYEGFAGPVNQALRPFPHMLNINERAAPVTDLTYHGAVLSLQKRYGHGLSFMLNYDPNDPSRNRYLNINAFANPAPFTFA